MNQILWIALGGALGAVLRYLMVAGVSYIFPYSFPNGTLVVNVLGCFAIGAVFALFAGSIQFQTQIRPFLVIGILGGFTTFSSYAMELTDLFRAEQFSKVMLYFLLSNVLGFAAAWFGYKAFAA